MDPYIVKESLSYDGVDYSPGDKVEMTAEDAGPLLRLRVLSKPPAKGKTAKK